MFSSANLSKLDKREATGDGGGGVGGCWSVGGGDDNQSTVLKAIRSMNGGQWGMW